MARRRTDRPVERLRSALTSTADLEETIAAMFPQPECAANVSQGSSSANSLASNDKPSSAELHIVSTPAKMWSVVPTPVERPAIVSTPVDTRQTKDNKDCVIVSTPVETAPLNTSQVFAAPVDTISQLSAEKLFLRRSRKRLFRPRRPSDAHTDGEDRLYQFMWEQGTRHQPGIRVYAGSMSTLARAMGRTDRNTRPLVESLIRKLSLAIAREQDYRTGAPRVYLVYDYSEIGRRRLNAGLEWALKNKGIQLVSTNEAEQLAVANIVSTPVDISPAVSTPVNTTRSVSTPVNTMSDRVPTPVQRPLSTPVHTGPPPYMENKVSEKTSTSPIICNAIMNVLGMVDDDAVALLIRKIRNVAPDASDEEIAEISGFQAQRIARMRNVDNPVGLLNAQVPKCFSGEAFARYRREKAEQAKRLQELYDQT